MAYVQHWPLHAHHQGRDCIVLLVTCRCCALADPNQGAKVVLSDSIGTLRTGLPADLNTPAIKAMHHESLVSALTCCWLFPPSLCPISCSPVFNERMVQSPCRPTQRCATLQAASVSAAIFLFTSAANQGRGGPWPGGDLPGVRDGGPA